MMKSVRIPLMAAAVSLLAAPCVLADSVVLNADVPFNFVVADRHFPSGEYRFVQGENSGVVRIYSKTQGHLATVLCQRVPAEATESGQLVFHKHGSQRFLKVIRSGDGSGVYFPKTGAESKVLASGDATAAVGTQ